MPSSPATHPQPLGKALLATLAAGLLLLSSGACKPKAGPPEAAAAGTDTPPADTTGDATAPEAPSTDAPEWTPTDSQAALVHALSARDASPPCQGLLALSPSAWEDLVAVITHVTAPPWVGMRGATCLVTELGEHPEAPALLTAWVTAEETAGLGLLVLNLLDQLPEETAVAVALAAVTDGPNPEAAAARVGRAGSAAVRAVAEAAGGEDSRDEGGGGE